MHPGLTTSTTSLSGLRQRIGQFFYGTEVPFGLAMIRILLPLAILIPSVHRWPYARELFSSDGATAQLSIGYGYGELLPEFSGPVAVGLYSAMLLFLVFTSIGLMTRLSVVAATVLYTYFTFIDSISTITKYTVIATDALLVLSVSACGTVWSVDSWLKNRQRLNWTPDAISTLPHSAVWPRRLLQLLIGTVYFGAAFTKIHTPEFFSGDQLRYWMLTHVNFSHRLGEYMAMHPVVLVIAAYVTIIWEMLFLFLAWRGLGRLCFLGLGVLFHTMTCLSLGLYIFPLVCISLYCSFLDEADIQTLAAHLRRWSRSADSWRGRLARRIRGWRLPSPASLPLVGQAPVPAVYACVLGAVVLLAVEVEYQMDHYGIRRSEGPHQLPRMDREQALKMIRGDRPLRESDKFFSFDLGSVVVSGILTNRRDEFKYGESIIAQCYLNPPHDDMWVECNLHDSEDRVVDRDGMVVLREMLRCNFVYNLGDKLEPGEYSLVLRSRGEEIMRRSFRLTGDPQPFRMMGN